MRRLQRRQSSPLLGPMRHTVLSKGPRSRRKRRGQFWSTAIGVGVALGIVFYWYLVFWVGDSPVDRHESGPEPPPVAEPAPPVVSALEPVEAAQIVREGIARTAKGMLTDGVRWDALTPCSPTQEATSRETGGPGRTSSCARFGARTSTSSC